MFIKINELKKLMKEAYKSGTLLIGNTTLQEENDGLVIAGGWWSVAVLYDYAPKELKAAVMELGGELPYCGNCYRALESGNQEHIGFTEYNNPKELFARTDISLNITRVIINFSDCVRILQREIDGKIIGVKNRTLALLDEKAIDFDNGEYEPVGPVANRTNEIVCWGNNMCWLSVWPYVLLDEEKENDRKLFFKDLEHISLLS